MIDRYTKALLTVIAVNITIMVRWGVAKVFVPEVRAYGENDHVIVVNGNCAPVPVKCVEGCN